MPQPALHVLLALRTLERWRAQPRGAPFDACAPDVANHFLHGALAPDIGFFPGADGRISRAVHEGGSGRVARALLGMARTDAETAFAWGWTTHVLADIEIHPLVNRAAAALVERDWGERATREHHRLAHTRIEVGLDVTVLERTPFLRSAHLQHAFDGSRIEFFANALRVVYDLPLVSRRLLRGHRMVTRCYNAYLRLAMLLSAERRLPRGRRADLRLRAVRVLGTYLLDERGPASGFLQPVMPADRFLERVDVAIARFTQHLEGHVAERMRHLGDHDLETGRPCAPITTRSASGEEWLRPFTMQRLRTSERPA